MKWKFSIVTILMMTGSLAFAASAPPADFLALEVCAKYSESQCTLQEFLDNGFVPEVSRSWENTAQGQWTLTLVSQDKVSKKTSKTIMAFNKVADSGKTFAEITRIISNDGKAFIARNGEVYSSADQEVSAAMLPSVVVPLIQTVNERTGRAAQARAQSKEKAARHEKVELKKDFDSVIGHYSQKSQKFDSNFIPYAVTEEVEISKVSDDTVKAKISAKCSKDQKDPLTVFDDQTLKLTYSSELGAYTSSLKVDKCDLVVKFGHGKMDSVQGVEFSDADTTPKPRRRGKKSESACCISGRFVKS